MSESTATATVDVILPCLDEAAALPAVLAGLPPGYRAIVVDNGSTDGSPEIAESLGATVVHEPRKGYGSACHSGLLAATADLVAFCDADHSLDLTELPSLVEPVATGDADLTLGWRRTNVGGAWPVHARVANRFLAWRVRRTTGAPIRDIAPIRVARRQELISLRIQDRRSGYPLETLIRAAEAGWRIREFPVTYSPRVGRSKVTGTVRGTLTAVKDMSTVLAANARREPAPSQPNDSPSRPGPAQ
jgi:glycosyltransferase involved in cell wall biosynthesis